MDSLLSPSQFSALSCLNANTLSSLQQINFGSYCSNHWSHQIDCSFEYQNSMIDFNRKQLTDVLSLCKLIWRHWTYKMPVRYILSSVWVRLSLFSQLSIIQNMGLCVFSLPISLVMIERIYTLSYCHHQIGSMFRVRSWNNGMRCMSLYSYSYQGTTSNSDYNQHYLLYFKFHLL